MMSFPCLRLDGEFFASFGPRTGNLVLKLDADRCTQIVDLGHGEVFAPNGRRFRQWVSIPPTRHRAWQHLLEEALSLAAKRRTQP
jgi:hypothetical protein